MISFHVYTKRFMKLNTVAVHTGYNCETTIQAVFDFVVMTLIGQKRQIIMVG
jgi:hypothetical protein